MKILFYSTKAFEKAFLENANHGKHELHFITEPLSARTVPMAAGFSVISIFTADDASGAVLEELHRIGVKNIATRAAGHDNIDLDAAKGLRIGVANVPDYSPYAIAEHAVALVLSLNRKIITANKQVHEQNFTLDNLVGFDLHGKTVGIIGLGKIGSVMARIMHGFGCRLLAYDVVQNEECIQRYGVDYVDLQTLCSQSDIISIHAPLNAQTKYMIDERLLHTMKKGVILVNTGRENGHIGACGLDVYENERGVFFFDHRGKELTDPLLKKLLSFSNLLITPHQAFATAEALQGIASATFASINAWAEGRPSPNELTRVAATA
jgi:D-lactate dehydrogenase